MNTTDWTAIITAATSLIATVTGLIILIVHIIRHQPIDPVNISESQQPSGPVIPVKPGNKP